MGLSLCFLSNPSHVLYQKIPLLDFSAYKDNIIYTSLQQFISSIKPNQNNLSGYVESPFPLIQEEPYFYRGNIIQNVRDNDLKGAGTVSKIWYEKHHNIGYDADKEEKNIDPTVINKFGTIKDKKQKYKVVKVNANTPLYMSVLDI